MTRLHEVEISGIRSVAHTIELRLGDVTTIVGPNQAGKSNLLFAIAAALDARVPFATDGDRSTAGSPEPPQVVLRAGGATTTVSWPAGQRTVVPDDTAITGPVLRVGPFDRLTELVAAAEVLPEELAALSMYLLAEVQAVLPDVTTVRVDADGDGYTATIADASGFPVDDRAGLRAPLVAGLARGLAAVGRGPVAVLIDQPEAFLHPAAQELVRDRLEALADDLDIPIIVTTESPFTLSRRESAKVIAIARDPQGATQVIGGTRGPEPQAVLLGGLFRDPGLAAILDRTTRLVDTVRGVLIVEGGTDEAYLRIAADVLGRSDELADLAIQPAGGAMAAALQAIVMRAETELPLLVLLDNDTPGQKAKGTLVGRFGFTNRRQVTSYAEVLDGNIDGAEAEDVWHHSLLERFIGERGERSITGKKLRNEGVWHYDLTSEAKSAFVGYARDTATPDAAGAWAGVLDLLADRFPPT